MASHVVVIDTTARRATVKVTPSTHLSDVLEEACKKLGYTADQYGLKYNNKAVDLSRTIRLSGLSSGAKLELVQLSKSPSVVSVALQLPASETRGLPSERLTDKFPSDTTLWLILRKFEAGVAGGAESGCPNLTAKSVPVTENGTSGAGGLYYQQPVVNIMGRELSNFTDLQKTLGQLGFNKGSVLLRLSFRTSQTPLYDAMAQIEEYFLSLGEDVPTRTGKGPAESSEPSGPTTDTAKPNEVASSTSAMTEDIPMSNTIDPNNQADSSISTNSAATISSRPIQIFSAPTSSTPSAASPINSSYNPADYVPTIEHAQSHQRLLSQSSRPTRLPTDAELAAQSQAAREKLASIPSVEIKIRFPDQTSIVSRFTQSDTGKSLYEFVRECLDPSLAAESFQIKYPTAHGRGQVTVPDDASDDKSRLIQGLELKGRVLMTFSWHPDAASEEARARKVVLKEDLRQKAKEIEVVDVGQLHQQDKAEDRTVSSTLGTEKLEKDKADGGGGKKVPKWLKLPGKK